MNKTEAERIAGAVHALRPDWHVNGLMTVLWDDRLRHMAYTDIAPVFVALALDDTSRKPTRIHEAGDWWTAAHRARPEHNTSAHIRRAAPDDCDVCNQPKAQHGPGRNDDHAYRQRNASGHGTPMPEQARQQLTNLSHHDTEETP